MNFWTLAKRSLRFHFRSHLGTGLGAALGSAVLVGALLVGDSIRESLREIALARLGQVESALDANDRFVRDTLASELQSVSGSKFAPVLRLLGVATATDGSARANEVQVIGADNRFWSLGGLDGFSAGAESDSVVLNERLARQLQTTPGSEILIRLKKPSLLASDLPLSSEKDSAIVIRARVKGVVSDSGFGRFNLRANQVAPFNVFLPLELLQKTISQPGRANLILGGTGSVASRLNRLLQDSWKTEDLQLRLQPLAGGRQELRSDRVFLDPALARSVEQQHPDATRILTYFVNELRAGERATPYSMVTATDGEAVPRGMKDGQIVINQWLAEDLSARPGDPIELRYFVPASGGRLEERTNRFQVASIIPIEGPAADRNLMPDFPGLAQAESSHDWDTGFPIDLKKIREKDEAYWKQFRGTPKAFVTLAAGQSMWTNRFGSLTALRFSADENANPAWFRRLDPATLGLAFEPVREQALRASAEAQDFGGLFLGFSFFLILAALLLMALLFQFGLEQRTAEVGTLLALGFTPRQVRKLLLIEGTALATLGSALGVFGGFVYAWLMVRGLTTIWRQAVGTTSLHFHATVPTLAIGLFASILVSALTIWVTLRQQGRRPAHELLSRGEELEMVADAPRKRFRPTSGIIAMVTMIGGVVLTALALAGSGGQSPGLFFGAGSLFLIGGIAGSLFILKRLGHPAGVALPTMGSLAVKNCARRRRRSAATVALLASGAFIIMAVAANRLGAPGDVFDRAGGTGGFPLMARSTTPVIRDLNLRAGREHYGLDEAALAGARFVSFRVREGDDASCLNLNRAQLPRLLGVNPAQLAERKAFTFSAPAGRARPADPWSLLRSGASGADEIPAVGDAASIQWALKKKVGDTIDYVDERGRPFKVRIVGALANSILQGNLLIDEARLMERYPSEAGYRMFLIDTPSNRAEAVAAELSRGLQDFGFEVSSTAERLAAFNAVQNTYLDTFQILGGLGLLLGSFGLGIVVLRNVLEREPELGLLQAVGFRRRSLRRLILCEHGVLLLGGLALGAVAALVAAIPAMRSHELPVRSLTVVPGIILAVGIFWTWVAARIALRKDLLSALRNN